MNNQLILWFDPKKGNVFDTQMNWIAYSRRDHLFSSATGSWLGPIQGSSFQDQQGKVIAWMPTLGKPENRGLPPLRPLIPLKPLAPLRPLRPLVPRTPLRPLPPLGGWSQLDAIAWFNT
ncbi:4-fold beta flower protein [Burkholderia contaminans]|uniref:4-fold beta flower protein n=1 Tax=Burkholderia contaminans TaxID=488447 RepID=UPI003F5BAECE